MKKSQKQKIIIIGSVGVLVIILISAALFFSTSRFNIFPQLVASHGNEQDVIKFPNIDQSTLSDKQRKVVSILQEQYKLQPSGTKYSQGANEPWCADFVSWVFNEAGVPLSNPNNGGWRIPGTYTLREYYEKIGKFESAQSGYTPKVGDIMLYDNPSPFGQHTNIVIENSNGVVTTIGGNEPGGIRVVRHDKGDGAGFIGYGVFSS